MGLDLSRCHTVAGPRIVVRFLHHFCPYGIQDHISAYFQEVAILLDQDRLVPALEQVAVPTVAFVEELGVNAVYLPHADRKVPVGGLDEEMIMVGHEALGVADPVVALVDVLKGVQKVQAILVILENRLFLVAAGRDVIHCAGVFDTKGTRHAARIAEERHKCKEKDLTLRSLGGAFL